MPDPAPVVGKLKRWLGLNPKGKGMALLEGQPPVAMKPTPPPKVVTEIPGTAPLIPNRLGAIGERIHPWVIGNIYKGDLYKELLAMPIGVELPPMTVTGLDWGVDEGNALTGGTFSNGVLPDTLLGGPCVSQDVQVDARGTFNINKTYAMPPGTVFGPGLVAYLENKMVGCTELNQSWGRWTTDCNIQFVASTQNTWSTWATNAYTANTGTIRIQATNVSTGTYMVASQQMLQDSWAGWSKQYHETKEQKEKRIADAKVAEQQWLEQQRNEAARVAKVKARAEKILVRNLTPEQALTLKEKNYFDVDIGEKVYRIHRGTHGNIRELSKEGKEVAILCVQPNGVPIEDAMLAQVLWLRADEKALLRVANRRLLTA